MALQICNLAQVILKKYFNPDQDALSEFKLDTYCRQNYIQLNADAVNDIKNCSFLQVKVIFDGIKKSFPPILLKCLALIKTLTFFNGESKTNYAGQLLLNKVFYLCSLHLQHQKEYFHC